MNKIFKYIGCAALAILAIDACSPDEFEGADPDKIPTVSGYSIVLDVDQTTNTATFSLSGDLTGCYPVWYLDGSNYSILPSASYTSLSAGDHSLEVYLMNRNGMSQASLESSFTFENTITDYSVYFNRLCDKEWRVDYSEAAHMGCGESGGDGSNWWSAGVNEKADWGVYDDRLTFTHSDSDEAAAGTYTYDPGEGGTVYVNYGCTSLNTTGATEDFMMEVSAQTAGFELVDGTYNDEACLYIQFDPYTLLPYIPNDAIYANPYYRIETLTNTRLAIVCDEGSIAWRLVLTSREDTGLVEDEEEEATYDWNYDSSANLWKTVDEGNYTVSQWFADDNWSQISDAAYSQDGDEWTITLPEGMGGSQWQGQFKIATSIAASASKAYNVYLLVEPDNDLSQMTIKLTDSSSDDNYFFADRHDFTADTQNVFKAEGVTLSAGTDASALTFVFDFGGSPVGTVVKISKIYIEEAIGYDSDENMWKAVDEGNYTLSMWFADDNWSQISDAEWSQNGSQWSITLPEGMGGSQWQGQFLISTSLSASLSSSYTFSCTVTPDNDLSQMTIKLTDSTNDGNYFFADRHDFTADKDNVYKVTGAILNTADINGTLQLVFDFGGSPAGTNVVISDIIFYEE